MLTFKQFINLFEAKIDNIIKGHVNKGHAPEEVNRVIDRAHAANRKGARIDISKPFLDVKKSVEEHEQKQASKSDIQTIHHNPKTGVTIKQVNTKDACIKGYGHGETNWCVASTGKGNLFDSYGKDGKRFFTIHHEDSETGKKTVYGIHERESVIRDVHNKSVNVETMHPDILHAMAKTPQLSEINVLTNNPHTTEEHITNVLENHNDDKAAITALAEHRRKITQNHIDMAMVHPYGSVAITALAGHKRKRKPHHIDMAMKHPDGKVAEEVLKYHADMIQPHHIDMAMESSRRVAETALYFNKDKIKPHHEEIARRRGII
jgi:hypothetical protein